MISLLQTRTEIPHSLVLFAVADPDLEVRGVGGGEYQFASAMWASAFVQN